MMHCFSCGSSNIAEEICEQQFAYGDKGVTLTASMPVISCEIVGKNVSMNAEKMHGLLL